MQQQSTIKLTSTLQNILTESVEREYAISQLQIVRSDFRLVTYLDVGNFRDKSTETTLHEMCVQVFLRFSYSSKPTIGLACWNRQILGNFM